jgi:hypothetical protein
MNYLINRPNGTITLGNVLDDANKSRPHVPNHIAQQVELLQHNAN